MIGFWEIELIIKTYNKGSTTVLRAKILGWLELTGDLLFALQQLETLSRQAVLSVIGQSVLLSVASTMQTVRLEWCRPNGEKYNILEQAVELVFNELPVFTDQMRDDGIIPPNASIDRAVCKFAAEIMSWTKDPATFELLEHRRYPIFLKWHGEAPVLVNEHEYGLWDE